VLADSPDCLDAHVKQWVLVFSKVVWSKIHPEQHSPTWILEF
jgi:hypothetical protein